MAQDDYTKLQLRVPKDLHAKVQASAEATGKSLNAELINRIEGSFSSGDRISELQAINTALAAGSNSHETSIRLLQQLIRDAGGFITALVDHHVAQTGNLNPVDESVQKFGIALTSGKVSAAFKALGEIQTWAQQNAADLGNFDFVTPYIKLTNPGVERDEQHEPPDTNEDGSAGS